MGEGELTSSHFILFVLCSHLKLHLSDTKKISINPMSFMLYILFILFMSYQVMNLKILCPREDSAGILKKCLQL